MTKTEAAKILGNAIAFRLQETHSPFEVQAAGRAWYTLGQLADPTSDLAKAIALCEGASQSRRQWNLIMRTAQELSVRLANAD